LEAMNGLNSDREKSLRRVRTLRNTWRTSKLLTRRGLRTNHPRYAGVIMHEKPWSEWVCRRSYIKGRQINQSRFGELGLCNFGTNARKRGGKAVARTGCEIIVGDNTCRFIRISIVSSRAAESHSSVPGGSPAAGRSFLSVIAFTVRLSQELVRRLRVFANGTNLSLSEIVGRALLAALPPRRKRG
jgi:hypothetical protein